MENNGTALAKRDPQDDGAIARRDQYELSVEAVVARKAKIVAVMRQVMREGEHYGKIPGCGDKPSLFKAGAEVLAFTFGLSPKFDIRRTDLPGGHREYEITCTLVTIGTDVIVGQGVGSCSTMESKYRWRGGGRKCPKCGMGTIIKSKYGKGEFAGGWLCYAKKGGCGTEWVAGDRAIEGQSIDRVENPDIADTYNTVLKMAKKRAQVDCTLTAVGASDLLTQDLEDLAPSARGDFNRNAMHDVDDADVIDMNTSGGYGDTERGLPFDHERQAKTAPERESSAQKQPTPEDVALELIADIEAAKSVQALQALLPRCQRLPKGTRPHAAALDCYQQRRRWLADQTAREAGGSAGAPA